MFWARLGGRAGLEARCPGVQTLGSVCFLPQHMDYNPVNVCVSMRERTLMHLNLNSNFHFGT